MEIGGKNRWKVAAGGCPGLRKSIQNCSRERPETPLSAQGPPRDDLERRRRAPKSSQNFPGAPGECPKMSRCKKKRNFGVPENIRKRPKAIKIDVDPPPGAKKSSLFLQKKRFLCPIGARTRFRSILYQFLSSFVFFVKRASPLKYCACRQKQGFGHARSVSTRLCKESRPNCGNRTQNRIKINKNLSTDPFGSPF